MNVWKISSRYLQNWRSYDIQYDKNRHFSSNFRTLLWFSDLFADSVIQNMFKVEFRILYENPAQKYAKTAKLHPEILWFHPFYLMTWDDLDLYHKSLIYNRRMGYSLNPLHLTLTPLTIKRHFLKRF